MVAHSVFGRMMIEPPTAMKRAWIMNYSCSTTKFTAPFPHRQKLGSAFRFVAGTTVRNKSHQPSSSVASCQMNVSSSCSQEGAGQRQLRAPVFIVYQRQQTNAASNEAETKEDSDGSISNDITTSSTYSSSSTGKNKEAPQCSVCGIVFTTKSHLRMHFRRHSGERPFSCSYCPKTFTRKDLKVSHERRHTGEKPYSCSVCGKSFADKSNFNTHKRVHTGEKPFACTICDRRFTQRSSLKNHLSSHSLGKTFSCEVCSKRFTRKVTLLLHMRLHTGKDLQTCSICDKICTSKSSLRAHEKRHIVSAAP